MSNVEARTDHAIVNHWLHQLGGSSGLRLQLDDAGICAVGHANGLDCAIEVPGGRGMVFLRIPLIPWAGTPPMLAERCLVENFLGISTGGASFAIDQQEREVVIWVARPLESLDAHRFCNLLLDFFEMALDRKHQLEDYCRNQAAAQAPQVERDASLMRMA